MKYAVIVSGGKQYKVMEGDEILVDSLPLKPDEKYTFTDVLLFTDDGKTKIGTPVIAGVTVSGSLIKQEKGEKIRVAKFKAKARYRKVIGYRHSLSKIKIEKIALKEK